RARYGSTECFASELRGLAGAEQCLRGAGVLDGPERLQSRDAGRLGKSAGVLRLLEFVPHVARRAATRSRVSRRGRSGERAADRRDFTPSLAGTFWRQSRGGRPIADRRYVLPAHLHHRRCDAAGLSVSRRHGALAAGRLEWFAAEPARRPLVERA